MASPLLSPPPAVGVADPVPLAEPVVDAAPAPPNVFTAFLRRWPWVAVGLAGGVVLGLLYHMQRPPVYQSNAQLLVIKNRPETMSSGTGDSRVAYVEDYVTTQVLFLRSEKILQLAAKRLDAQKPFAVAPPEKERDRVAVMTAGFAVQREKEPGSNQPSNILGLTFKGSDPADTPKYLRAIIDAYQGELNTLYSQATAAAIRDTSGAIQTYVNAKTQAEASREKAERELLAISKEEVGSIRARITANRTTQSALQLKAAELASQLELIDKVKGASRRERLAVMAMLGVQSRQASVTSLDSRNPEDVLFTFELQRGELAQKLGKDHPDMQSIDGKIRMLKELIARGSPDAKAELDELALHHAHVLQEQQAVDLKLKLVRHELAEDDEKVLRMGTFAVQKEAAERAIRDHDQSISQKTIELNQLRGTASAAGYKAEDVTSPKDGVQVAPVLWQSLMLGAVLGLLLGGSLATLAELGDRGFRTPAEIRRRLGVPVLGHIPKLKGEQPAGGTAALDPMLVTVHRPTSTEAEAYRGVRTQLYFSTQGRGHQVIQVTSPNPGDGKSTLAANMAVCIAQSGKRVVLLDCDFRKPRVHKLFRIPAPDMGLATVMAGDATLTQATQACGVPNLSLLPCGPRPGNPAELLTSPKFQEILGELRERFDFVVIDTPPVLAVSDPSAVAPRADGVLMVFRMTKEARPAAERAREQLAAVGARVIGVVVNASTARSGGYGGYGYSYQYDYQYADDYSDADEAAPPPPKKG